MSEEISIIEQVDMPGACVTLRSDGVVEFFLKHNHTVNLQDAKAIVEATEKIGKGKKFPLLITAGKFALVDTEVRYYASSPEANRFTIASAIVVSNLAQKLLGNAYIKFNKPPTPTQLFTSEKEALKWLYTFR